MSACRRLASAAVAFTLVASPSYALDLNLGPLGLGVGTPQGLLTTALATPAVNSTAAVGGSGAIAGLSAQTSLASANASAGLTGVGAGVGNGSGGGLNLALGAPPPPPPPPGGSIDNGFGFETYGIRGMNGITEGQIAMALASAYGGLASGEQQLLRNQCGSILANPAAFEASLVALCRMVARIRMMN